LLIYNEAEIEWSWEILMENLGRFLKNYWIKVDRLDCSGVYLEDLKPR
jgi:hypothetical protein